MSAAHASEFFTRYCFVKGCSLYVGMDVILARITSIHPIIPYGCGMAYGRYGYRIRLEVSSRWLPHIKPKFKSFNATTMNILYDQTVFL